jgi:hypothetical protein
LVLANAIEARESFGHHPDLEVVAAPGEVLDLHAGAGEGVTNSRLDLVRMHHGSFGKGGEGCGEI